MCGGDGGGLWWFLVPKMVTLLMFLPLVPLEYMPSNNVLRCFFLCVNYVVVCTNTMMFFRVNKLYYDVFCV
jgi:hypothetical protein